MPLGQTTPIGFAQAFLTTVLFHGMYKKLPEFNGHTFEIAEEATPSLLRIPIKQLDLRITLQYLSLNRVGIPTRRPKMEFL
jgi:hypothetical protein